MKALIKRGNPNEVKKIDKARLNEALLYASSQQNPNILFIKELLNLGAQINYQGKNNNFALDLACNNGKVKFAAGLLACGANPNLTSGERDTSPLMQACAVGNIPLCQLLINAGANVNELNKENGTPLMNAAGLGYLELIRILCAAGAKIDLCNGLGYTALMNAVGLKKVTAAKLLIDLGAHPEIENHNHETALSMALDRRLIDLFEYMINPLSRANKETTS